MSRVNLRRSDRRTVRETVSVSWLDAQGNQKFYSTYCFDVSKEGLSVNMSEPIPVGSAVAVRSGKLKIAGPALVKNCVRRHSSYRIGLEFTGKIDPA
jgi:hypothetical protein